MVGVFKQHQALDGEGIFIGNATSLLVPANPHYQGSSRLLFDEHNQPVEADKLTPAQRARCTWRRCYKLESLLHTHRAGEFFLYGGLRVSAGKDPENPLLYELVEAFVHYPGRGVMKRLILDRAFLDGPRLGRCKKELNVEVLIPARTNLDIYHPRIAIERYSASLTWWKRLRPRAVVSEWQLATQFGSGFRGPCVLRIIFSHRQGTLPRGSSTATLFLPPCLRSAASRSRLEPIAISAISLGRP